MGQSRTRMQTSPSRLCWRIQYRLSTLLVVVAIFAITFAVVARWLYGIRQEEAVADFVEQAGGQVTYRHELTSSPQTVDRIRAPGPRWMRKIFGSHCLANIVHVDLFGSPKSELTLDRLRQLGRLSGLQQLCFDNSEITDESLEHLSSSGRMEVLTLANTKVTDIGLAHIATLKTLRSLDLAGTDITDAGLPHLQSLICLEELFLDRTNTSSIAVGQLQSALPNARLWWRKSVGRISQTVSVPRTSWPR